MTFSELNIQDNKPSSSFINFISNLNFSNAYEEAVIDQHPKIIKVGEMSYKVLEEDRNETSYFTKSDKDQRNKSESDASKQELSVDEPRDYVTPILQLQIVPIQADHFLAQLPVHLSHFIKDLVSIVKQYNIQSSTMDYHFKFKNLEMNVICSKKDEALKIIIQVGDKELQNELNKKYQDHMVSYLKKELDNENLAVEFEFIKEQENSNQENSHHQENNNQQHDNSENDNEDPE